MLCAMEKLLLDVEADLSYLYIRIPKACFCSAEDFIYSYEFGKISFSARSCILP
jgi:hypothetical protein